MLLLILTQALRYPGSHIWLSCQDLKSARAMMVETWWPLIASSPLADLFTLRKSSGSEQLQCTNGSVVHLLTATSKLAGHGSVCDLYVGDEYFAVQDTRLETAMLPAQATRSSFGGGPRSIFVSTPGTPSTSQPLLQRTERGRQLVANSVQNGVAYVEWSAPDDADPSDPAVWAAANPAYGITISEDAVQAEYDSLELVDFRRSRLAQWTTTVNDPVIDLAAWEKLVDVQSKRGKSLALAFDSSPVGEWSSIAVASVRDDGLYHVAVLAHREGTGWLGICQAI
jgi:phage terminase large subunit-like protein